MTPSGKVRPPPASRETLKSVGDPKKRGPPTRAPVAGLPNGSRSVSARAMATPPRAALSDGKIANWSPCATGTVLMAIS
jgi:hypothetical protein